MILQKKFRRKKFIPLLAVLISLLIISSVIAIWHVTLRSDATFEFTSTKPTDINGLSLIEVMESFTFDVTNQSVNHTETVIFNNAGETARFFFVNWSIEKTDIDDQCLDWENDILVELYGHKEGTPPVLQTEPLEVRFDEGNTLFDFVLSAEEGSCPQDIEVWISLEQPA